MTFANNIVRDMAYTLQDIKVETGSKAVTQNVSLKRAVSCFRLEATDPMPLTTNTQDITISGSCGTVFNPSTGFCKERLPSPEVGLLTPKIPEPIHQIHTLHSSDRQ